MATVNAIVWKLCILYNEKSGLCVTMLYFAKKEYSMLPKAWIVLTKIAMILIRHLDPHMLQP